MHVSSGTSSNRVIVGLTLGMMLAACPSRALAGISVISQSRGISVNLLGPPAPISDAKAASDYLPFNQSLDVTGTDYGLHASINQQSTINASSTQLALNAQGSSPTDGGQDVEHGGADSRSYYMVTFQTDVPVTYSINWQYTVDFSTGHGPVVAAIFNGSTYVDGLMQQMDNPEIFGAIPLPHSYNGTLPPGTYTLDGDTSLQAASGDAINNLAYTASFLVTTGTASVPLPTPLALGILGLLTCTPLMTRGGCRMVGALD
jgi:hypothetical protein